MSWTNKAPMIFEEDGHRVVVGETVNLRTQSIEGCDGRPLTVAYPHQEGQLLACEGNQDVTLNQQQVEFLGKYGKFTR